MKQRVKRVKLAPSMKRNGGLPLSSYSMKQVGTYTQNVAWMYFQIWYGIKTADARVLLKHGHVHVRRYIRI
jgi:hypothetical protein